MKDRRKHKESKKAREMNKIEENQRIKVNDSMETDSRIVSESWQNLAHPAIIFMAVDRQSPVEVDSFRLHKKVSESCQNPPVPDIVSFVAISDIDFQCQNLGKSGKYCQDTAKKFPDVCFQRSRDFRVIKK